MLDYLVVGCFVSLEKTNSDVGLAAVVGTEEGCFVVVCPDMLEIDFGTFGFRRYYRIVVGYGVFVGFGVQALHSIVGCGNYLVSEYDRPDEYSYKECELCYQSTLESKRCHPVCLLFGSSFANLDYLP